MSFLVKLARLSQVVWLVLKLIKKILDDLD